MKPKTRTLKYHKDSIKFGNKKEKTKDSSTLFYYAISHYQLFYNVKSKNWTTFWEATKYFNKEHVEMNKKYLEEKYNINLQVTECINFGCIN